MSHTANVGKSLVPYPGLTEPWPRAASVAPHGPAVLVLSSRPCLLVLDSLSNYYHLFERRAKRETHTQRYQHRGVHLLAIAIPKVSVSSSGTF